MHTHATKMVACFVQKHLRLIHTSRRASWRAAVGAVTTGHLLSLSRLAGGLFGRVTQKAALKPVYGAESAAAAAKRPEEFDAGPWDAKHPAITSS